MPLTRPLIGPAPTFKTHSMQPGDLVVVWGGTHPRATMYVDDGSYSYTEVAVARGTTGTVVETVTSKAHKDGYIKVMLSDSQLGYIYKDAMRPLQ